MYEQNTVRKLVEPGDLIVSAEKKNVRPTLWAVPHGDPLTDARWVRVLETTPCCKIEWFMFDPRKLKSIAVDVGRQ